MNESRFSFSLNEFALGGKRNGKEGVQFWKSYRRKICDLTVANQVASFSTYLRPGPLAHGLYLKKHVRNQGINYLLVIGTSVFWYWKSCIWLLKNLFVCFRNRHQLCTYHSNTILSQLTLGILIVKLFECFFFLNFIPQGSWPNLEN